MAIIYANCETGMLEGQYSGDQRVTVFKGIPYAKPPIGDLRWKAPQKADCWEGVRKAWSYSRIPIQPVRSSPFYKKHFFPAEMPQDEDCLYLNVWTPAKTPEDKLPVAVWIYGGAYTTGYANKQEFDGETFAKRGCVYVSFNYRLGILGYLAHPELSAECEEHISGNYGMMDQIAALEWVQRNIAAFGGDPKQVTIFGQSAGAMSCMDLSCSPKTEGLFQRTICESCGGMSYEFYRDMPALAQAEEFGKKTMDKMGFPDLKSMREASAEDIMQRWMGVGINGIAFRPNIDGIFMLYSAAETVMRNKHHKIDYLIGSTENEGYAFNLGKVYSPTEYKAGAEHYFGDQADTFLEAVGFTEDGTELPADNFGDNMLSSGIAWNELELKRHGQTTYQYFFTRKVPEEECGAFHSGEHAYIFQTLDRFSFHYQDWDYTLSRMMCEYWCNFIKTGDPNGEGLPRWERYQSGEKKIMDLGDNPHMSGLPSRPGALFAVKYMLQEAERIAEFT